MFGDGVGGLKEALMTQKERLLDLFHRKSVWTNHELRDLTPAMYQYPARIKELNEDLRKQGFEIVGEFDKNDHKKYLYQLREIKPVQGDLFLPKCA